jgi:hypothetical protein
MELTNFERLPRNLPQEHLEAAHEVMLGMHKPAELRSSAITNGGVLIFVENHDQSGSLNDLVDVERIRLGNAAGQATRFGGFFLVVFRVPFEERDRSGLPRDKLFLREGVGPPHSSRENESGFSLSLSRWGRNRANGADWCVHHSSEDRSGTSRLPCQ